MKLNRLFLNVLLVLSLCLTGVVAMAQGDETRWLILNTSPEPTLIELTGSLRINEDGDMEATPVDPAACTGDPNSDLDCDDVEVASPTFRVNNSTSATVTDDSALQFSWNSQGAWSCDGGGDLPNWNAREGLPARSADATVGQRTLSASGLASETPYQATLTCSNGPVDIVESVSITINESGADLPEECSSPSRQPPAGWTRLTSGNQNCVWRSTGGFDTSKDCSFWTKQDQQENQIGIWNSGVLGTSGNTRRFALRSANAQDYIAIEFDTSGLSTTDWGQFNLNTATGLTSRKNIMSISKCPGDFNYDAIQAETGCIRSSYTGSLFWSGGSPNVGCELEPGKTYYWNIIYTNTEPGPGVTGQNIEPEPDCAQSTTRCGHVFNPVRN